MTPESTQNKLLVSSRGRGLANWFNPAGRGMGMWAFVLNRITGIGLVVYLALHFIMLAKLAQGPASYDGFIALARSRLFLLFDLVLMAGLLIHGLNGIRVALVGMGLASTRSQKPTFVVFMLLAAVALVLAAVRILA